MTLKGTGDFYELFGNDLASRRHLIWMWHLLDTPAGTLNPGAFGFGMRECLGRFIKANPHLKDGVLNNFGSMVLPDEKLDWIGDSERQNEFVSREFSRQMSLPGLGVHHSLVGRERTVAIIDASPGGLVMKSYVLEGVRIAWAKHTESDRYFRWFSACDEKERCGFLWDWLVKNKIDYVQYRTRFYNVDDALLLFDRAYITAGERELIADKVKRAFSQRKFREKQNGKKQCNLVLQEKSIKSLDQMAKKYGLSRAEIIEILIQDESVRGAYISARLERHRHLVQGNQAVQPNGRFSV